MAHADMRMIMAGFLVFWCGGLVPRGLIGSHPAALNSGGGENPAGLPAPRRRAIVVNTLAVDGKKRLFRVLYGIYIARQHACTETKYQIILILTRRESLIGSQSCR